ncbi:MOSC domain-containing protein [Hymenobacter volaticus]|uniref:MOSC domain-containing protein n=1 Tax=Hymenobacter volaticus TaxID=2932254 RepID=A0ABY4GFR8_9BACT|nr:MOSC domain-containing protein [Hymenobacter volaticus]UOQ69653.1 MOSC domain-containing protein [Hymenobacter volaticus]
MQIVSVNVGLPQEVHWKGRAVITSIFKQPVLGPVAVHAEHLAGDGQADLRVHGGPDKAVYAYPQEHYAYWQPLVPPELLGPGALGENLTTTGLLESEVRMGDCFRAGTAVLMAVQPRRPCFKLGIRLNDERVVKQFQEARRCGIYFRVVQTGVLQAGDALELVERSPYAVTIQDVADCYYLPEKDYTKLMQILALPFLPPSWREGFEKLAAAQSS